MTEPIKTVTRQSKKAHKRILELLDPNYEELDPEDREAAEGLAWDLHHAVLEEYHSRPFYVAIVIHDGFPGTWGPFPTDSAAKKFAGHLVSLGFPQVKTAKTYTHWPQQAEELAELYGWNITEDAA